MSKKHGKTIKYHAMLLEKYQGKTIFALNIYCGIPVEFYKQFLN